MSAKQNISNKDPIGMAMDGRLYRYLGDHMREPEVLARLRLETSKMPRAGMQIPPDEGIFMGMLVKLMGVKRYVEVGVFTGYSSLSVALALPRDGKVVALDIDPAPIEVARRYWAEAGVSDIIDCRIAPGEESLANVTEEYGEGSFDMAFIDADKTSYRAYYEALLKLVRPGGLILVDNVLWFGKVADPNVNDEDTVAIRELNAFLKTDERIDFNIVAIGDGIAMCRKR